MLEDPVGLAIKKTRHFDERWENAPGILKIQSAGDVIGDDPGGHAGGGGGFKTVGGILDDETFPGIDLEAPGGFEKEIGRGLDAWGIAPADGDGDVPGEIQAFEPTIDPGVRGTGDDGAGHASGGE